MKIHYLQPYAPDKNLGKAYNEAAKLVPDEDWICFTDADAMFLQFDYGHKLLQVIEEHPGPALFTCLTNRIKNQAQLYGDNMSAKGDIRYHRRLANVIWDKHGTKVKQLPAMGLSGFMILFPKKIWNEVKFHEKGMLKVDNLFSRTVHRGGYPLYVMKGIYMFHYYRLLEGDNYKKHLTVDRSIKLK